MPDEGQDQPAQLYCTLSVHNDDEHPEGIVIYDPEELPLKQGSLYLLAARLASSAVQDFQNISSSTANPSSRENDIAKSSSRKRQYDTRKPSGLDSHADTSKSMVFVAQPLQPSTDSKRKSRGVQISVNSSAASVFGFRNNMQVVVVPVEQDLHTASHVEIVFRDQYLSRADMWRLTVSELNQRSIFKGQRIHFMGSIKATIKNIYSSGRRISSAYFSSDTKPIFRSESAKYVIYIQMSREMWDFDAEGSGEIMFSKVINGFLPDLFKRWQRMSVRHLVSIVLFTRMEYDKGTLIHHDDEEYTYDEDGIHGKDVDFRDYYRVVTTEANSGKWVDILYRLRREFLLFLRDVSIVGGNDTYGRPPETIAGVKATTTMESVIAGQPTTAARGNILEAINLASSQFARDYIDRDLVRTGISLAIITAGTGVFEVDYNMLKLTTDVLVGSGIGVDLVSLARMPLHSVPLFRYRSPRVPHAPPGFHHGPMSFHAGSTPRQSVLPRNSAAGATFRQGGQFPSKNGAEPAFGTQVESGVEWSYALPHWIDVSFWTGHADEAQVRAQHGLADGRKGSDRKIKRPFTTSCRMYELQMMGLMENEMSDIAIALLPDRLHEVPKGLATIGSHPKETRISDSVGSSKSYLDSHMQLIRRKGATLPAINDTKDLLDSMNQYDRDVFDEPETSTKTILEHVNHDAAQNNMTSLGLSPNKTRQKEISSSFASDTTPRGDGGGGGGGWKAGTSPHKRDRAVRESHDRISNQATPAVRKRAPMPRQISLGPRGLGTAKSVASTSVSTESAGVTPVAETAPPLSPPSPAPAQHQPASSRFSSLTQQLLNTLTRKPSQASLAQTVRSDQGSESDSITTSSQAYRSIPITIKDQTGDKDDESQMITVRDASMPKVDDIVLRDASMIGRQSGPRAASGSGPTGNNFDLHRTLSPLSAMSPWLTMLNPSNPKKHNMNIASQFRRWQHVFPRAIPTSAIKWKSLCCPAALPLTNEYFPSAEQLKNDYHEYTYKIMPIDDDEMSEAPHTREALMRELVSCRLSHGFQIVVGSAADEFVGSDAASLVEVFNKNYMTEDGATVLMTIGNHLHQLLCTDDGEIEIRRYIRKPVAAVESVGAVDPSVPYKPYIRTYLAHGYVLQPIIFKNPRPTYYWNAIDQHLAGYEEEFSPVLRYSRARFVLIPVNPTIRGGQLGFVSENSDEEIRLEGIQKLTQLWQKNRYVPPEERRFQQSLQQKKKDPNPLAIEYHTRDPSQMVRNHVGLADTLLAGEPAHQALNDPEQYHTSDFDMQKLAQHLQADPPRGVPLADRRWHFRNHHRCFRGDHLTSWLLSNFKDIQTREEAVKLGDALMERGLFTHVMQKHHFRDGNYFYQIAGEYSTLPASDMRQSWFGSGRSVPSTPMFEGPKGSPMLRPRDSPSLRPWASPKLRPSDSPRLRPWDTSRSHPAERSGTGSSMETLSVDSSSKTFGKKPKLVLSRVLRYDVDHRKRSYRPEIINLHYDRIHNPENCYHLRLDWMNATPKLIEDAISSWASCVERYGLRLVEVPIAEGYELLSQHPFRRPYIIKLCIPPPKTRPTYDTDSVTSQHTQDESKETHPYSRAILRKYDFVLDLEAASSFDQGVEVTFSWGKPDYRYTQFIHKSGALLIQISDDGDFMLCANRLCVDRSSAARDVGKYDKAERSERSEQRRGQVPLSPFTSPHIRPVSDTPARNGKKTRLDGSAESNTDPEHIKDLLEKLCHNPQRLQEFYDQAFSKETGTPSPSPRNAPVSDELIPSLGLPPAITLRSISFLDSPRGPGPTSRRASTQGMPKSSE
ncbi:hypothetical protein AAFC00_006962 [Neodothiora populina]|uniref:Vacuolar membrane-associated protein IML1 n=1 Tax=Neodothiora populina TaxID=2781224 RepID=A0ABR3PBR9_9PEZI